MRFNKYFVSLALVFVLNSVNATVPERKGWWKFDNPSDLLKAEDSCLASLQLVGSHEVAPGPTDGNGAVTIGVGSYYKLQHAIEANGGGTFVNEYSLLFDVKVPSLSVWHSFFQTDTANISDADFFINPEGSIGVAAVGYSGYTIKNSEWYRLVIAVKTPTLFTVYLDGKVLLTGNPQTLDDRFSLNQFLLIFADENGEDGEISCAELSIWNQYLTSEQAEELGGYGHKVGTAEMARIPYLQSPGTSSMVVCWHDTVESVPTLRYGTDSLLGSETLGSSEFIKYSYWWNTVSLEGLQPNTSYYYQLLSGNDTSDTYIFKTLPDTAYQGILRFVVLGDTHATDTTMSMKLLKEVRKKLETLYGSGIQDHVQAIIHSGDLVVSGNSIDHYSVQYFRPMAALSGNIATMAVAGNHEGESPYFYQYMKLDNYSAFPDNANLNEKVWRFRVGNTLYLGLNTNITASYGTTMANWLNTQLNEAESNPSIDFVFLVMHHPPYSELWYDVVTFDAGPDYVTKRLFPIIKKYTKVQQIHYGHTHGFERGTIVSGQPDADFRIICGGGSGGPLDPWNEPAVHDYADIHKTYSEYFFQVVEVDIANHSYQNSVYSLGDLVSPKPSTLLDQWYKKKDQSKPATPVIESITKNGEALQINLSTFSGSDSLMSVQIQFFDGTSSNILALDTCFHWKNVFGVDAQGKPVDLNEKFNLNQLEIPAPKLPKTRNLLCKVRYRDHNLKWSEWSAAYTFDVVGIIENPSDHTHYFLGQNYPNPFKSSTQIDYLLPEKGNVKFQFLNQQNQIVASFNEGLKERGSHSIMFEGQELESGIYYYQLIANKTILMKEMIKTQ
jgi:hypothetical protein